MLRRGEKSQNVPRKKVDTEHIQGNCSLYFMPVIITLVVIGIIQRQLTKETLNLIFRLLQI